MKAWYEIEFLVRCLACLIWLIRIAIYGLPYLILCCVRRLLDDHNSVGPRTR
ncbi:hypothetical protein LCGC14_0325700 [marine sediment metagenome]|uniref:Uncharacterized protein n=1 Tax=marine sediment metagenome TaxID=412755 RepID=A0A0F9TNC5_9ZZZZ